MPDVIHIFACSYHCIAHIFYNCIGFLLPIISSPNFKFYAGLIYFYTSQNRARWVWTSSYLVLISWLMGMANRASVNSALLKPFSLRSTMVVNLPCLWGSCPNFLRPTCPYTECQPSSVTGSCPKEETPAGYSSCLLLVHY